MPSRLGRGQLDPVPVLILARLALEVSEEAMAWLARTGYDPAYGARPLKRVIQRHIADPLALALLDGRYGEGDTVTVDVAGADLVLK